MSLCSYTEQQRQNIQPSHGLPIDSRVLHQATSTPRSSTLQLRFYGSAPIERSSTFSEINSKDISYFKSILGEHNVILDPDRLEPANWDWMHKYKGSSKLMLIPRNTEEVTLSFSVFKLSVELNALCLYVYVFVSLCMCL